MSEKPNVAIVAALTFLGSIAMGCTTALIIMEKPFEVISGLVLGPVVTGLLIYAGIKIGQSKGQ